MNGFYYLHSETKDLIWKKFEPESDSPFVKWVWPIDTTDRKDAWIIVLEGLALGASTERIRALCNKWHCDQNDFEEMLARIKLSALMQKGTEIFLKAILKLNPEQYWDDLLERKAKDKTA